MREGRKSAYIEPSVNTTLRIIFCLNSRDNLQTIGIGKAKIIRSAIPCKCLPMACTTRRARLTDDVHDPVSDIEGLLINTSVCLNSQVPVSQ